MNLLPTDQKYAVHQGDCIPHMLEEMPPQSVDFSVFSPPFPSLFSYTSKAEDIGTSENMKGEAKIHLSYFFRGLARVLKPGRAVVVHVMQIPRLKRSGEVGLHDYRGLNIRLGERAGLVYEYDWVVRKNPQAQAIRTRSRELQFAGLESDRAKQRGCLPDYLIKFRAPGENEVAIDSDGDVSRNEWIEWAECCWSNIRETNTMNVKEARSEEDTKHICPLQLDVIDRLVRLYSNPGEVVFSPFTGIGSEGYVSLQRGRSFYGCELKPEYHAQALKNLAKAERTHKADSKTLFDAAEAVA